MGDYGDKNPMLLAPTAEEIALSSSSSSSSSNGAAGLPAIFSPPSLVNPKDVDIEMGNSSMTDDEIPTSASGRVSDGRERLSTIDFITQALFTGTVPARSPRTMDGRESFDGRGSVTNRNSSGKANALPVSTFYCGICLGNQALADMFEIPSCDQAELHRFCRDCVEGYVRSQVVCNHTLVSCPGVSPKCKGVIDSDSLRDVVKESGDKELVVKLERFLAMSKSENFRECPKRLEDGTTCNHPCSTASVSNPRIVCEKCSYEYCFIHANAHPDEECEVYSARMLKEETLNKKFIDETTKQCPSCEAHTMKNGGCNHMKCQHCSADWCWICGKEIKGGGGGVTDHYATGGPCAFQQFSWTEDGGMGEPPLGDILLLYRCLGYDNPNELSLEFRLLCGFVNLLLMVSIQGLVGILVLPILLVGLAVGCALCPCLFAGLACGVFEVCDDDFGV